MQLLEFFQKTTSSSGAADGGEGRAIKKKVEPSRSSPVKSEEKGEKTFVTQVRPDDAKSDQLKTSPLTEADDLRKTRSDFTEKVGYLCMLCQQDLQLWWSS